MSVALITCQRFAKLPSDERLLVDALAQRGVAAFPRVWSDRSDDWDHIELAVLRSCWDYHEKPRRFRSWVKLTSRVTRVFNPPELILWNMHKEYLAELAAAGIPIVPTILVRMGQSASVDDLRRKLLTEEFVIKPAVSASASRTTVIGRGHVPFDSAQRDLDDLLRDQDALVQPFLREIYDLQERSLIFIDGAFSHAVKRPPLSTGAAGGDSRESLIDPSAEEIALANRVLAVAPSETLYARVDLIPRYDGSFALAELEVIEPALYLGHHAPSVAKLADAIISKLENRS